LCAPQVFADQVVAAAILDRLLHHATVVNKGKNYRMRHHQEHSKAKGGVAHNLSELCTFFVS
jgi:hypothetical protein